jgi:hypothetical protein
MQGNCEGSPGQEEVQINIFMWKVMVIICTLGNPCSVFQEDPVVYYKTQAECVAVAQTKEAQLMGSFVDIGFTVISSAAKCDDFPRA